jgi:hypothetical protein
MVGDLVDPRRREPPFILGERDMLEAWLKFHRTTLLLSAKGSVTAIAKLVRCPARSCRCTARLARWICVHMIEEYARHNGHADLIRELVDGSVGW